AAHSGERSKIPALLGKMRKIKPLWCLLSPFAYSFEFRLSCKWMSKVHALVPLTEQEEEVEGILLQHAISHLTHAVFPIRNRMYVVDFFLPNQRVAVECWRSTSRRGVALTWVEKNAPYVNLKFRRIKETNPDDRCIALVEVMRAELELVGEWVGHLVEHGGVLPCERNKVVENLRGRVI